MPVYVDNMNAPYGRMIMCHLIADTTEELLAMVDKIYVPRKWIQDAGTNREHFDICIVKKRLAIKNGAIEISYGGELAEMLSQRDRGEKMVPRNKRKGRK